ncbi:DUF2628 domain-containing protein [Pseudaminobacter sp. NGMCC 1.201702]|uniref:DUF2628 domain-containing protein n=1 Tax=Pseudaminobacter sp. NGMCC 1.201702 TaxID=3391825 RepID=UPI0039F081CC
MASYVVMEPPGRKGEAASNAVFVRDGFSLVAFLVPPLWLLWYRLWIEAALAVAAALALGALGEIAGFGMTGTLLSLLVSVYVGLEGAALRIAALRRRGWHEWGVVEADRAGDAELRYLAEADFADSAVEPVLAPSPQPSRARPAGPALGLLNYPGRA